MFGVAVPARPGAQHQRAPWWSHTWAGVFVLLALTAGALLICRIPAVGHWITYWTGQDNEAGGRYGLWSGFLGAVQPTLILTAVGVYWHHSCHSARCWLPGRHPGGAGSVRLCRYHHPDIRGRKLTADVVAELHELAHWRLHHPPVPRS